MTINVLCECGMKLSARPEFAGKRGICPYCGRTFVIPGSPPEVVQAVAAANSWGGPPPPVQPLPTARRLEEEPLDVVEFLDPPSSPFAPPPPRTPWFRKMMQALLDPRSIQWLLMIGGGLMVLGVVIWLISLGVFQNPYVVAVVLGLGSLAVHASGCFVSLQTKYKTAGRALTFLGCVVLPLNVWYYQYQGLATIEGHLWVGVFVCCLIYAGTVYFLRDPLFMYAVEAGLTLTLLLLLAALGYGTIASAMTLSLALLGIALVSIHAERAFPPDGETFSRARFGMPLFWSGHVQLAAALLFLAFAQVLHWFQLPGEMLLGIQWTDTALTESRWLAGAIWIAGAYAYIYSDLVVRRVGLYSYLAAVCCIMAELSVIGIDVSPEILIPVIALTGLVIGLARVMAADQNERMARTLPPLSMILSFLAVAIGVAVHVRATSHLLAEFQWQAETGWAFVGAMLVAAACSRALAFVERKLHPGYAAVYFFHSAAAVIVGAAGLLRMLNLTEWHQQAPLLMVIPLVYLVASHLWRGKSASQPLGWVAHAAAAVILLHAVLGSVDLVETVLRPITGRLENLLLGVTFAEAALFYTLAAVWRRKSANVYLAALAACGAIWELVGYADISDAYYTLIFAGAGIALIALSRVLGVSESDAYRDTGLPFKRLGGKGAALYQAGNAVLAMAFVAAFVQGVFRIVAQKQGVEGLLALTLTALAGGLAIVLAARRAERWLHTTATVALAGLAFLTLNVLLDLSVWQKVEIFSVAIGLALLVVSYIGRFREEETTDAVSVGLWIGSLLAAGALFVAVMAYRATTGPSLVDELALLTVTILMLASGCGLQFKAPTLIGGSTLGLYLAVVIVQLAYRPQIAVGVYLAIGGAALFGVGVGLSIYRDRLLALPEKFARREGLFRVIGWR